MLLRPPCLSLMTYLMLIFADSDVYLDFLMLRLLRLFLYLLEVRLRAAEKGLRVQSHHPL